MRNLVLGAISTLVLAGCVTTSPKVEPASFDYYTVTGETPRYQTLAPWRIPPGQTEPLRELEVWLKDLDSQEYLKIAPVPELGCPQCVAVGGAISGDSKRVFFELYGSDPNREAQRVYFYDTQNGKYRQVIFASLRCRRPGAAPWLHAHRTSRASSLRGREPYRFGYCHNCRFA